MTEDERKEMFEMRQKYNEQLGKARSYWHEELEKARSKVFFWKCTAVFGILFLLYIIALLRGCLSLGGDIPDMP